MEVVKTDEDQEKQSLEDLDLDLDLDREIEKQEGLEAEASKKEVFINQEKVNEVINKKHREKMEAEERAAALQNQLAESNAALAKLQKTEEPVIPSMPDSFDEDFEQRIKERDAAIAAKAAFNKQQEFTTQQQDSDLRQKVVVRQQALDNIVTKFSERITELGLDATKFKANEAVVTSYNLGPDIAEFILSEQEGPLIVNYLASNVLELESLVSMNPLAAAAHIRAVITPEAIKLKPKQTETTDPSKILEGTQGVSSENSLLEGATFE